MYVSNRSWRFVTFYISALEVLLITYLLTYLLTENQENVRPFALFTPPEGVAGVTGLHKLINCWRLQLGES